MLYSILLLIYKKEDKTGNTQVLGQTILLNILDKYIYIINYVENCKVIKNIRYRWVDFLYSICYYIFIERRKQYDKHTY